MSQAYFAHISPGLEPLLKDELRSLGARKLKIDEGGVHFQGTRKHLYRILWWSRLAHRVYWTLAEGTAPNTHALFERVTKIPWVEIFGAHPKALKLAIKVSLGHHAELQGTGQVESIAYRAIERALEGSRPLSSAHWSDPSTEVARVLIRLHDHRVSIRLDACGSLLHKRGWRTIEGLAPLRPTLASAMIKLLEWDPQEPLIDPMCGSGTIPIEAAKLASLRPPRLWSDYSCTHWAQFDPQMWENERGYVSRNQGEISTNFHQHIFASDLSSEALSATQTHLTAAGEMVHVSLQDALTLSPPSEQRADTQEGLILFNPPYGLRIREQDVLKTFLNHFAEAKNEWKGWRVGLIYPRQLSPPATPGLVARELARFQHGGLPVWVWRYEHL